MKKKENKIGLITFSRAHNYGSILQAYALQKYLNDKFCNSCEILDFSNEKQKKMYSIFKSDLTVKNAIKNVIAFFTYPLMKREYNDFEKFINKNLIFTSKKFSTSQELSEVEDQFDTFVAGSDQVWNIKCEDADDAYFLNFVKDKKKVAYAPSFGAKNILEYSDKPEYYRDLINSFDCVSIREKNGQKWIKDLTGNDVPLLIDPTMFYSKEDWYSLMAPAFIKKPYILYYSFHFTQEINKAVKEISRKLNMPVVILSAHAWVYNFGALYGFKLAKHAGPSEFLRLINDAEIVFSNSFHGTVFSAIFEKNFWFLYGSIQDKTDDRALTMVNQLGIEDRVLKLSDIDKCDFYEMPNYEDVNKKLETLRKSAFNYIDDAISKDASENE